MSTDKGRQPGERLRLVVSESTNSPQRLKRLARDLRECAESVSWPDFGDKLIEAAELLEVQAVVIEAGYSQRVRVL
jgi:hypothetical protein